MCLSPKKILNRSRAFKDGVSRSYIYVPCGHCDECRQQMHDEWYLRIKQEYDDCISQGGLVAFVTFTYSELTIPKFFFHGKDGKPKGCYCFSKHHKDTYIKHLRDFFRSDNEDRKSMNFRYIWASEYGDDSKYTQRSHYHALFFLYPELLDKYGRDEMFWKQLFARFWSAPEYLHLGMTRYSPRASLFVDSSFCLLYVSKYMTKDLGFYNTPNIQEYMSEDFKISKDNEKYQAIKDYLPRHWQSPYFGANLESKFDNIDVFCDGYNFGVNDQNYSKEGTAKTYDCPQYIQKRMLYKTLPDGRKVLNEKGKLFKAEYYKRNLERLIRRYMSYGDEEYLKKRVSDEDIQNHPVLKQFGNLEGLLEYLKHNVHSEQQAALLYFYNTVWSDLLCSPDSYPDFMDMSVNEFIDVSVNQYIASLSKEDYDFYDEDGYIVKNIKVLQQKYQIENEYKSIEFFDGVQPVLDIISIIEVIYRRRCTEKYLQKRREKKNMMKDILSNYKTIDYGCIS